MYSVHFRATLHGALDAPATLRLPVIARFDPAAAAELTAAAHRIVAELAGAAPGCQAAAHADCARILILLWRASASLNGDDPTAELPADVLRVLPALQLIETQLAERVTVPTLAAAVHLDPSYFSLLFRRVTGVPPLRYVIRRRLDRSFELLSTTAMPLREVAQRCGFSDALYFSRAFRRSQGVPPTEYRRLRQDAAAP